MNELTTERQLLAILFSDIVGFSSMMSSDEEATMQRLERNNHIHQHAVDLFGGRIIKVVGDGMFCAFPSAINACRAALRIQKQIREEDYDLRVGIHLGDVILKDNDAFGDGVNIAARVEAKARSGRVWVTQNIADSLVGVSDLGVYERGKHELKNIDRPVTLFELKDPDLKDSSKDKVKEALPTAMKRVRTFTISTAAVLVTLAGLYEGYDILTNEIITDEPVIEVATPKLSIAFNSSAPPTDQMLSIERYMTERLRAHSSIEVMDVVRTRDLDVSDLLQLPAEERPDLILKLSLEQIEPVMLGVDLLNSRNASRINQQAISRRLSETEGVMTRDLLRAVFYQLEQNALIKDKSDFMLESYRRIYPIEYSVSEEYSLPGYAPLDYGFKEPTISDLLTDITLDAKQFVVFDLNQVDHTHKQLIIIHSLLDRLHNLNVRFHPLVESLSQALDDIMAKTDGLAQNQMMIRLLKAKIHLMKYEWQNALVQFENGQFDDPIIVELASQILMEFSHEVGYLEASEVEALFDRFDLDNATMEAEINAVDAVVNGQSEDALSSSKSLQQLNPEIAGFIAREIYLKNADKTAALSALKMTKQLQYSPLKFAEIIVRAEPGSMELLSLAKDYQEAVNQQQMTLSEAAWDLLALEDTQGFMTVADEALKNGAFDPFLIASVSLNQEMAQSPIINLWLRELKLPEFWQTYGLPGFCTREENPIDCSAKNSGEQ